ncbi:uncharacterized protein E0L32_004665 [Thyridium curvatum]|uniref:Malate dehydrogenase n=1 Tax=Thyridium curvatum TaxID=1093900 RepID=A0A507B5R8_9PEZI|nr:uncharacterized protein E0L32_004665 [Thyridium curvatum]TPX15107.1 hypothetical protein E0L32_004665 [Thyridium curvatum]
MHASTLLLSALAAFAVAAPTYPQLNVDAVTPAGLDALSDYFNKLAQKVQQSKSLAEAPACDLTKAVLPRQPPSPSSLPDPTKGLVLKHVAIGRGTQNYTCANDTAAPVLAGAVAALYNASCLAAAQPELMGPLAQASLAAGLALRPGETPLTVTARLAPSQLVVSGRHFFRDPTTPFFDLDAQPADQIGTAPTAKNNTEPAPAGAPRGQKGEAAVPWLKLLAKEGATGDLREVYRVETVGGSAPPSCKDMPASFEVQYAAQYWFYEGKPQEQQQS